MSPWDSAAGRVTGSSDVPFHKVGTGDDLAPVGTSGLPAPGKSRSGQEDLTWVVAVVG